MPYDISVTDKPDRKAVIDAETERSARRESVPFRGEIKEIPAIRVPLGLPLYRVNSGRTRVAQLEHIREAGKPPDYFVAGEEDTSVQRAQHNILLEMAKDSTADIYSELELTRRQSESLLVTAFGVVVNGNRRLAAMRDLYESAPETCAAFSHVDVKVLPETATTVDIETIEAELQLVPETKLEYGWVEELLKLRSHVEELGISRAEVRRIWRIRSEMVLNARLQMLALAEEYLAEYLRMPQAYREIEQSEELFRVLQRESAGKAGIELDRARLLAFPLVKEARNLGSRVYGYRRAFGELAEEVVERLAAAKGITLDFASEGREGAGGEDVDEDDPLVGIEDEGSVLPEQLVSLLMDKDQSEDLAELIVSIHDEMQMEEDDEGRRTAALRHVKAANRSLHSVDLTISDPATFREMLAQLREVVAHSTTLKQEVQESLEQRG